MRFFRPSCWIMLLMPLMMCSPGCEIGRSWFSMSSDSPMPWFGIDLMPRRRTSQVLPAYRKDAKTSQVASTRPQQNGETTSRKGERKVWVKELHLPSIPPFFDDPEEVQLTFEGPKAPFGD